MTTHLDIDALALVHATASRPRMDNGNMVVDSAFARAGGMKQTGKDIKGRQTIHYCLQSAVTDHAYGKFEGRQWIIVAPLKEAIEVNGRPETLLSSDVAFFPKDGAMTLPKAQLIEFTNALPEGEFIRKTPGGLLVSSTLNDTNIGQARTWFDDLSAQGAKVSSIQKQLSLPGEWSRSQITELGVASALAQLGKPALSHLRGIKPGDPMGFDGWMGHSELEAIKQEIETISPDNDDMGPVRVGRHDGMAGDRLLSAVAKLNHDEIREIEIGPTTPPRISLAARNWRQSDLLKQHRQIAILNELQEGNALISNEFGQERPGLVGALFGTQSGQSFSHPQMGTITLDEVNEATKAVSVDVRNQLMTSFETRSQEGIGMAGAFQQAQHWLAAFNHAPPIIPPSISQWRAQRAEDETLKSKLPTGIGWKPFELLWRPDGSGTT